MVAVAHHLVVLDEVRLVRGLQPVARFLVAGVVVLAVGVRVKKVEREFSTIIDQGSALLKAGLVALVILGVCLALKRARVADAVPEAHVYQRAAYLVACRYQRTAHLVTRRGIVHHVHPLDAVGGHRPEQGVELLRAHVRHLATGAGRRVAPCPCSSPCRPGRWSRPARRGSTRRSSPPRRAGISKRRRCCPQAFPRLIFAGHTPASPPWPSPRGVRLSPSLRAGSSPGCPPRGCPSSSLVRRCLTNKTLQARIKSFVSSFCLYQVSLCPIFACQTSYLEAFNVLHRYDEKAFLV